MFTDSRWWWPFWNEGRWRHYQKFCFQQGWPNSFSFETVITFISFNRLSELIYVLLHFLLKINYSKFFVFQDPSTPRSSCEKSPINDKTNSRWVLYLMKANVSFQFFLFFQLFICNSWPCQWLTQAPVTSEEE